MEIWDSRVFVVVLAVSACRNDWCGCLLPWITTSITDVDKMVFNDPS